MKNHATLFYGIPADAARELDGETPTNAELCAALMNALYRIRGMEMIIEKLQAKIPADETE